MSYFGNSKVYKFFRPKLQYTGLLSERSESDTGLSYTTQHKSDTQRSDLRSENHSALEVV